MKSATRYTFRRRAVHSHHESTEDPRTSAERRPFLESLVLGALADMPLEWSDVPSSRHAEREAPLGLPGAELAYRAMKQLVGRYPGLLDAEVKVYSPCVEGVGDYAVDDGGLRVAEGVYVAGDACGRFRGIVASMVSGRYVAERLLAGR